MKSEIGVDYSWLTTGIITVLIADASRTSIDLRFEAVAYTDTLH